MLPRLEAQKEHPYITKIAREYRSSQGWEQGRNISIYYNNNVTQNTHFKSTIILGSENMGQLYQKRKKCARVEIYVFLFKIG